MSNDTKKLNRQEIHNLVTDLFHEYWTHIANQIGYMNQLLEGCTDEDLAYADALEDELMSQPAYEELCNKHYELVTKLHMRIGFNVGTEDGALN